MPQRPLRILMISSEVESLARTGGLGDVAEALSVHLARMGLDVLIVTPLYGVTKVPDARRRWDEPLSVRVGAWPHGVRQLGVVQVEIAEVEAPGRLRVLLLDDPSLYGRAGIYGDEHGPFGDNELRFATLSKAALEASRVVWGELEEGGGPDVIHAHDWHAALAVLYARLTMGPAWAERKSVFTIHNLAYQGVTGRDTVAELGVPAAALTPDVLAHDDSVNLLKGAIALADRVTTVSPTYAQEILTPELGFGLDAFLRRHAGKLRGILNGIDMARFDPATDRALVARFGASDFEAGKRACKAGLLRELRLESEGALDAPLFSSVSRLSWQKGIDLILAVAPDLVAEGGRLALVGQGEAGLEGSLRGLAAQHPGRVCARIAFDGELARRVYAGSDFFFIPSRFEPCGLTQMYAMRYGALPIVTSVGGLRDTVTPIDRATGRGTGIVARHPTVGDLRRAIEEAFSCWADRAGMRAAIARAMARDSSWGQSARAYVELYRELVT
jgi:starch synthase